MRHLGKFSTSDFEDDIQSVRDTQISDGLTRLDAFEE
jgi:hypothetical protein